LASAIVTHHAKRLGTLKKVCQILAEYRTQQEAIQSKLRQIETKAKFVCFLREAQGSNLKQSPAKQGNSYSIRLLTGGL